MYIRHLFLRTMHHDAIWRTREISLNFDHLLCSLEKSNIFLDIFFLTLEHNSLSLRHVCLATKGQQDI